MAEAKTGLLGRLLQRGSDEEPEKGPIAVHKIKTPKYDQQTGPYDLPARIKFRGLFDIDSLYRFMAHWLKHHKYEFHETLYKFKPPEMELRWRAERRKTGFVKEIINLHLHMWGEYDVEIIAKGKKKKMANARMVLDIDGALEAPYSDLFGKRRWNLPMERRLLSIFHRYVLKREFELEYIDVLYYEIYNFLADIKEHMKLEARGSGY
ncbi:hypothetical protein JXB11_04335 [Candidatus Woesearchaeota archaeon]|nr:hypothetical protein [Candidatus Woesearchaeota archaeon]